MHAATVIQKSQRAASKKALTTELKGQLYKRSNMTPRFQRRSFFVRDDGTLGPCLSYRGGDDEVSGDLKSIPLASITEVKVGAKGYEFHVESTARQAPYIFRAECKADFDMWIDGLQTLIT